LQEVESAKLSTTSRRRRADALPVRIELSGQGRPLWTVFHQDGTSSTELVLLWEQPWIGGPLGQDEGRAIAAKFRAAGLEPWWVSRRLRWHADLLGKNQPYRRKGSAPATAETVADLRKRRRALELALAANRKPSMFVSLELPARLESAIKDLCAAEETLAYTANCTHESFLLDLQERCDLKLDELVRIFRGHPDELERLRGVPRGGKKEPGSLKLWVRNAIARERERRKSR
jgi:hypothetical protein